MSRGFKVPILLPADPTALLEAATKQYVDFASVPRFASTAARDTWSSPPNGAICVTTDTNTAWQRVAGVWLPTAGSVPFLRLTKNSQQNINSGAFTDIIWNTINDNRLFSFTVGSASITIPYAGYYLITSTISWRESAGGALRMNRIMNGAGFELATGQLGQFGAGYGVQVPVHAALGFNAGDTFKIDAYQDSGAALGVREATGSAANSVLAISWIGVK